MRSPPAAMRPSSSSCVSPPVCPPPPPSPAPSRRRRKHPIMGKPCTLLSDTVHAAREREKELKHGKEHRGSSVISADQKSLGHLKLSDVYSSVD